MQFLPVTHAQLALARSLDDLAPVDQPSLWKKALTWSGMSLASILLVSGLRQRRWSLLTLGTAGIGCLIAWHLHGTTRQRDFSHTAAKLNTLVLSHDWSGLVARLDELKSDLKENTRLSQKLTRNLLNLRILVAANRVIQLQDKLTESRTELRQLVTWLTPHLVNQPDSAEWNLVRSISQRVLS